MICHRDGRTWSPGWSAGAVSSASSVAVGYAELGPAGIAVGDSCVAGVLVGGCQRRSELCHQPGGGCPLCHLRSLLNPHIVAMSLLPVILRLAAPWGDLARPV